MPSTLTLFLSTSTLFLSRVAIVWVLHKLVIWEKNIGKTIKRQNKFNAVIPIPIKKILFSKLKISKPEPLAMPKHKNIPKVPWKE